jgi:hypothetical protein
MSPGFCDTGIILFRLVRNRCTAASGCSCYDVVD